MLYEGLYAVKFQTSLGEGGGVVVLKKGEIMGGDSHFYYLGSYQADGDGLIASLQVRRHFDTPEAQTVFGVDPITMNLKGQLPGSHGDLTGTAIEAPDVEFTATLDLLSSPPN